MTAPSGRSIQPVTAAMRWMLYIASVLVFIAGVQTYVLSEDTDRFFAWTIGVPLTAAFLGAGYWAATLLEFLLARERAWANARSTVPAVWLFTTLTLIATLLHLSAFHTDTVQGWAWLIVYGGVPVVLGAVLVLQWRAPGEDPSPSEPLPVWFRAVLAGQGLVLGVLGIGLFLAPSTFDGLWPWPLTALTARASAAWLIALAVMLGQFVLENDWRRVRIGLLGYLLWGILILLALARYSGTPDWNGAQAWFFLAFVLTILAAGGYGTYRNWRGRLGLALEADAAR